MCFQKVYRIWSHLIENLNQSTNVFVSVGLQKEYMLMMRSVYIVLEPQKYFFITINHNKPLNSLRFAFFHFL